MKTNETTEKTETKNENRMTLDGLVAIDEAKIEYCYDMEISIEDANE